MNRRKFVAFVDEEFLGNRFPPKTILDLGEGKGENLGEFAKRGWVVEGHDIKNDGFDFNELPLPFKDEEFDCVLMSFTLRFVDDWHCFLREVKRILKPTGRFVVYDTKGIGVRLLDYTPFHHVYFQRFPWYAFYPHSRFLAVGKKFKVTKK